MPNFRHTVVLMMTMVACFVGLTKADVALSKPLPPLAVGWQQTADDGEQRQLTLTLTPTLVMTRLTVAITGSGDARPTGDTDWHGPLDAGASVSLLVRVPSSARGTVTATITGVTASNVHFSLAGAIHVPESAAILSPPKRPASPPQRVREFMAR